MNDQDAEVGKPLLDGIGSTGAAKFIENLEQTEEGAASAPNSFSIRIGHHAMRLEVGQEAEFGAHPQQITIQRGLLLVAGGEDQIVPGMVHAVGGCWAVKR